MSAAEAWSLRAGYGYADHNDLGQILSLASDPDNSNTASGGIAIGRLLSANTWDLPLDFYLKSDLNWFFENGYQDGFPELTLYLKVYWNLHPWNTTFRLGFGEGVSYAFGIPHVEKAEAERENDNNSRILNYLDITFDFDAGRLVRCKPLEATFFGVAIKHRSGIYGLINGVRHGGSNYLLLYAEHNF